MEDIREPKKIYEYLNISILTIINKLKNETDDEKLKASKDSVLQLIDTFKKNRLDVEIKDLKNSQEWEIFTVAFYGETNAGKSTIIETLRIFFQEKEKADQQKQFKDIFNAYQKNRDKLESQVKSLERDILEQESKIENLTSNFKIKKKELEEKINKITSEDLNRKESSFFYKILTFLHIINIKKEINKLILEINEQTTTHNEETKNFSNLLDEKDKELKNIKLELQNLESNTVNSLQKFVDGQIIGDGKSDFTKKSTVYNFEHNKQKFAFLDVPGIEGHETIVIDEISSAVKKAHAVFYVTSSATPPQKGDENKKGTLEKIKEHLGSQTEIYTIFNKRVTNPMQLSKALVSDDEKESLKIVDEKIFEILGENYVGHKSVSAKVAFLALADCLLIGSMHHNEQKKFLDNFSSDELLEKALLDDLCRFISDEMVVNTKQKVKKSNYNKASNLLNELVEILDKASKENFEPLYKQIIKEVDDGSSNLKNTKLNLESVIEKGLREFENTTRKEIYSFIDSDVGDDSFKSKLESLLKDNSKKMLESISKDIEKQMSKFQDSITEVLENFKRRIDLAIQNYQAFDFGSFDSNFNINLNINNGIDGWGVAGSLLGAGATAYWAITAGNIWNPAGWTMATVGIVVSAVAILISFGKSIYKIFSSDYKRSEQRKSADENLDRIVKDIKPKITEKIKPIEQKVTVLIDNIIDDLENIVKQRKLANEYIKNTHRDLVLVSKQIKLEGDK